MGLEKTYYNIKRKTLMCKERNMKMCWTVKLFFVLMSEASISSCSQVIIPAGNLIVDLHVDG